MNEKYITISAVSFVIGFAISIWPRSCYDKFKKLIQQRGENPNQRIPLKQMKELDSQLYKKYLLGVILWIPFSVAFTGFAIAAWITK